MFDDYHIRVKKEYAASLIEHLRKEQAIELIEDNEPKIPEWQKEAIRKTLQQVKENPELLQPWETFKQKYMRSDI
jgi:Putative addiction module component